MTNHDLRRNADNEPVCVCGYRPEALNTWGPTDARNLRARTAVLDHAKALNEAITPGETQPMDFGPAIQWAEKVLGIELTPWQKNILQRSPEAPFVVSERTRYPRAGVRLLPSGQWRLTLWDEPDVIHAWENESVAVHPDRYTACAFGEMVIGAHRQAGTRLNGMGL